MLAHFSLIAHVREQWMKWEWTAFSTYRMSWLMAFLVVCLVPVHFFVPCDASGVLVNAGGVLLITTLALCIPGKGGGRFVPLCVAILGFLGHVCCAH